MWVPLKSGLIGQIEVTRVMGLRWPSKVSRIQESAYSGNSVLPEVQDKPCEEAQALRNQQGFRADCENGSYRKALGRQILAY